MTNEEIKVEATVKKLAAPTTAWAYLSSRFTYLTAEQWLALIQQGKISINDETVAPETLVGNGTVLQTLLPAPPADIPAYSIIYEDKWLTAINKPAGLRVHGTGRFMRANLIYHLRQNHCEAAKLINRLDSDTSGVILIAKTKAVLRAVQAQFVQKEVKKTYLAYVHGQPPLSGSICHSLREGIKDSRYRYMFPDPRGSAARTDFSVLKQLDNEVALLKLHPRTGRTHQLRVHLAAIHHPIVGDRQYGFPDDRPRFKLERHLLHCLRTSFYHPVLQTNLTVEAPSPEDFRY